MREQNNEHLRGHASKRSDFTVTTLSAVGLRRESMPERVHLCQAWGCGTHDEGAHPTVPLRPCTRDYVSIVPPTAAMNCLPPVPDCSPAYRDTLWAIQGNSIALGNLQKSIIEAEMKPAEHRHPGKLPGWSQIPKHRSESLNSPPRNSPLSRKSPGNEYRTKIMPGTRQ
jgi:hypothetical protein